MTRHVYAALIVLALSALACGQYVGTPTPVPTPTPPRPTPTPSAVPTDTPRATEAAAVNDTAIVRQVSVNVRSEPGGVATGEYVYQGQELTVLDTVMLENGDEWVQIAEPAGWIFSGCLEGSERGCVAE
jgi:hypothetical protein